MPDRQDPPAPSQRSPARRVRDADVRHDLAALAAGLRAKFFLGAGDGVGVVVSSNAAHKGYLSGFHSMGYDLEPGYQSAVVATRDRTALVVGAADAGPALEVIGDPALVYRYGTFYYETAPDAEPQGFDLPGADTFNDAVTQALADLAPGGERIGVDRTNGDALWGLVAGLRGADKLVDVTDAFRLARATKLDGEVARIRKATKLVEDGLNAVISHARVGMTEHEIAALVTNAITVGGGLPRFVIATSGPRAALVDAYPSSRTMQSGDLLRLDVGCVVDGYWSDMARTIVFGDPDPLQETRYRAIGAGLEDELAAVRQGVTAEAVFEAAVGSVRRNGIPHYKRHNCGHGVGLNVHEYPPLAKGASDVLEAGMCLCLETPYYELGWAGMMVEDTILVTVGGYEPITTMPRQLFVI